MGFIIESFDNPIDFRYLYETKYRLLLRRKDSPELIITTTDLSRLPFDIVSKGRIVEVSLSKIYPNLNWQVVSRIDNQYYDRLYHACQEHLSEKLGEKYTQDFILRHVFEIAPELINRAEDLIVALLKRHYKNIQIPEILDKVLISTLGKKEVFNGWPLDKIVTDRYAFWTFLQKNWQVFLDSITNKSIHCIIPFEYDDIRVYVDNLFAEGFLTPIDYKIDIPHKLSWINIGLSSRKESIENKFESLIEVTKDTLPNIDSSHNEWLSFCIKYSKLISAYYSAESDNPEIRPFRKQANKIFEEWLLKKYGSLCNLPASKPVMVHHILRWMAAHSSTKQALLVIDGLSLSQWITIETEIKNQLSDCSVNESALYAWIPTITSISRQAIFSGKVPLFFSNSIFNTQREEKLWQAFWKNYDISDRDVIYKNGIGSNDENILDNLHINSRTKYIGLVINTVDDIMHGMQLGESGMHNQIRLWAKKGMLAHLIKDLINLDYKIIITSDHGNAEGSSIGTPTEGAIPDLKGQRVRIYSDHELCKKTHSEFKETIIWPPLGLPDNIYPLIAKENNLFGNPNQSMVAHGGISLEETIVPFIIIEK